MDLQQLLLFLQHCLMPSLTCQGLAVSLLLMQDTTAAAVVTGMPPTAAHALKGAADAGDKLLCAAVALAAAALSMLAGATDV